MISDAEILEKPYYIARQKEQRILQNKKNENYEEADNESHNLIIGKTGRKNSNSTVNCSQ